MTEVDELGSGREIEAADVLAQSGQGELRSATVRDDDGIVRVLQDLEPLYPRRRRIAARVPPLAVVSQEALARQRGLRSDVDAGGEVAEIVVVGDFVQIEPAQEGTIAVVGVNQTNCRAAAVGSEVLRKHLGLEFAVVVLVQITELLGDLKSALFHITGGERQVVVGREVQVIWNCDLGPALAGDAERRRKEARFALIVQRKIKSGCRDDGHSLETNAAAAGGPHLAREVQVQLVGPDQPAVVARLAGGEEAVLDSVLVLAQDLARLGLSARPYGLLAGLRARGESKVGLLEKAGRIPERIRQRRTAQTVAVALEAHVAAGFDVLIFLVIDQ